MLSRRQLVLLFAAGCTCCVAPLRAQSAFDHSHAAWDGLLRKHVRLTTEGGASQVNYKALAEERAALRAYMQSLSAVPAAQFASWSKTQQYAFLANAYNAFTVEKILTRYPNLKSIRDFGSIIGTSNVGWASRCAGPGGNYCPAEAATRCNSACFSVKSLGRINHADMID